jgi:hypothetical protein
MITDTKKHRAKKIEPGVYDYREYRIVRYQMPDSSAVYWQLYKMSEESGNSLYQGFDETGHTTHSLWLAKQLIEFLSTASN